MEWNSLLSAIVGGFIATLPSILANRFESGEREKDRAEKKEGSENAGNRKINWK